MLDIDLSQFEIDTSQLIDIDEIIENNPDLFFEIDPSQFPEIDLSQFEIE